MGFVISTRDATASVMGLQTLNEIYDGRFVLGVSHAPLVSDLRGHKYRERLATMRAYLGDMDKAWDALGGTPAEKQVILVALGPRMLQLGGERTLGVMPANVTAAHALIAREKVGADGLVWSEVHVSMANDPKQARSAARAALDFYFQLSHYIKIWERLGFSDADFENGGSDALIDALVGWGEVEHIEARLQENLDNGVGQLVIHAIRPGSQPGPDWNALQTLAPGAR